ncbi:hypothetical protein G6F35_017787 [Rhizopus arrhizus]|nr:hypothetical protein G6F35_017787 [Rhizopus arrhizus]KAG1390675.1 hypothetical protein G6F59_015121 [Rhizopus arrhizus]
MPAAVRRQSTGAARPVRWRGRRNAVGRRPCLDCRAEPCCAAVEGDDAVPDGPSGVDCAPPTHRPRPAVITPP